MNLPVLVGVLLAVGSFGSIQAEVDEDGFRPLFNGENLEGWVNVTTAASTWTVQDGLLHCSGKPIGELRTTKMFQNFVLELEWRHLKPKGNAGIFIWADDITARGQPFHRGVEVQVLENEYGNTESHTTHGDIFPIHGARMTPINGRGGSRAFPTENLSKPSPEWNHYRITCQDGAISLAVNGTLVTQGVDCSPSKGYICLESEGGVVDYRNMRIKELPDTEVDPEDVATADRGYECLYTGVDLSAWRVAPGARENWKSRDWTLHYDGQASNGDAAIRTVLEFGDFGFLFDFRPSDGAVMRFSPRGSEAGMIDIFEEDKDGDGGWRAGWNRIEGTLSGNRMTISLNGHEIDTSEALVGLPTSGPLLFESTRALDLANLFVRELD